MSRPRQLVDGVRRFAFHTNSTRDLPLPLTEKGYAISSPEAGSWRRRKTWCALLADLPSCAVRATLRVSALPRGTGSERAPLEGILRERSS
jgi:hypothetical protein